MEPITKLKDVLQKQPLYLTVVALVTIFTFNKTAEPHGLELIIASFSTVIIGLVVSTLKDIKMAKIEAEKVIVVPQMSKDDSEPKMAAGGGAQIANTEQTKASEEQDLSEDIQKAS